VGVTGPGHGQYMLWKNNNGLIIIPAFSFSEDRMRYKIPCLIFAGMLGLTGTGCRTTPSPGSQDPGAIELTLTSSGSILTAGKLTDLDHLARQLHRAGATLDTPITINIPADTPFASVSTITSRLASAGYRRILFKRPKRADASTQTLQPLALPLQP
jgi:hypothetical protein